MQKWLLMDWLAWAQGMVAVGSGGLGLLESDCFPTGQLWDICVWTVCSSDLGIILHIRRV